MTLLVTRSPPKIINPLPITTPQLWEVLITDSSGSLRYCASLPSTSVNSLTVRTSIETCISLACDASSAPRPTTVRFFRGEMFNMLSIALAQVDVVAKPSRATHALNGWLAERHEGVYPKMEGYDARLRKAKAAQVRMSVRRAGCAAEHSAPPHPPVSNVRPSPSSTSTLLPPSASPTPSSANATPS